MNSSVLIIDTIHTSFEDVLHANGIKTIKAYEWSREKVLMEIGHFEGLSIRSRFKIDADFLYSARHLKCIGRAGAGMENIDVATATKLGIHCVNAPEGSKDAVAEHALGMLLMLLNHLQRADTEVRNGIWRREENRGIELEGKTVGIVGFGNMGRSFARRLIGFGVRILALDPYITLDEKVFPYVEQCDENTFFETCDIVSLHVPLTAETASMVNTQWLRRFKKPIYLLNTARGKNVDTAALTEAIKLGIVAGAALDVLEYETISFENIEHRNLPEPFKFLVGSDKVVLSPHIAGWTIESNHKIATILAEKMVAVLSAKD